MTYKLIDYEDLKAFSDSLKTKYATKNDVPKTLSDLQEDTTHRLVTDSEKKNWNSKVGSKEGYGLSKNDYDDTEKEKLNSSINKIVFRAQPKRDTANLICTDNTGNTVNVNLPMVQGYFSGLMSCKDKAKLDAIDRGANRVTLLSQLENDTNFKTESEIQSMIEKASSLKKEVVTSLPATGKDDVIYLVKDPKGKDNNNYLEYLWLNGKYELIGSTQVDLSGYVTKEQAQANETVLRNDMMGLSEYLTTELENTLNKEKDKAVISDNTDFLNNTLYTTPYFVKQTATIQLQEAMGGIYTNIEQILDTKVNVADIQEFTQQELEEAFK